MATEVKAGQLRRWSELSASEALFGLPEEGGWESGNVFLVMSVAGAWSSLLLETGALRETTTLVVRKGSEVLDESR